jgi:hypothetical protein
MPLRFPQVYSRTTPNPSDSAVSLTINYTPCFEGNRLAARYSLDDNRRLLYWAFGPYPYIDRCEAVGEARDPERPANNYYLS